MSRNHIVSHFSCQHEYISLLHKFAPINPKLIRKEVFEIIRSTFPTIKFWSILSKMDTLKESNDVKDTSATAQLSPFKIYVVRSCLLQSLIL
jgi:hypothetical protein